MAVILQHTINVYQNLSNFNNFHINVNKLKIFTFITIRTTLHLGISEGHPPLSYNFTQWPMYVKFTTNQSFCSTCIRSVLLGIRQSNEWFFNRK